MRKIISLSFALVLLVSLFSPNYVLAASLIGVSNVKLAPSVSATVRYSDWLAGTASTLDILLSDVSDSTVLSDGVYVGWCIQPRITGLLHDEPATLFSSLNENNLPSDLVGLPWNKINYVLNHKIRGVGKTDLDYFKDVQTAIWVLLGDTDPEYGIGTEAQQMIDDANGNSDFVPGDGDLVAYIIYSDGMSSRKYSSVQEVIIEVKLSLPPNGSPTPTATESVTPSPTTTPPTGTVTPSPTEPSPTTTPSTDTVTPTLPSPTTTPPTGTVTPSPTEPSPTTTPPTCQPTSVTADFSQFAVGTSVEGMGVVASGLNIDAKGTAVKILEGSQPGIYGAGIGNAVINGGVVAGGFSDVTTKQLKQPHLYAFTFEPGTSVSNFSLRMLDFGDLNPTSASTSYASMTAYNANGYVIAKQELKYTTTGVYFSPEYGNLFNSGDALLAVPGEPGNWTWNVSGSGIVKIVLEFGVGFDPNIGFDTLTFTTTCP